MIMIIYEVIPRGKMYVSLIFDSESALNKHLEAYIFL